MQLVYLFSSQRLLYTSHRGPVFVVTYGPAPLLRQLGLDTERIIVYFSSKGVNHVEYRASVVEVVWCVPQFVYQLCHRIQTHRHFNYRSQFQYRQKPHPLISSRAVRRRHYRPRIKYQKTARSTVGVEPKTFRTAATGDDADQCLYRNDHRGL